MKIVNNAIFWTSLEVSADDNHKLGGQRGVHALVQIEYGYLLVQ